MNWGKAHLLKDWKSGLEKMDLKEKEMSARISLTERKKTNPAAKRKAGVITLSQCSKSQSDQSASLYRGKQEKGTGKEVLKMLKGA